MCHRNSVMITALTAMVAFHGRRRCNHRCRYGRASITAPIVQMPPSRKHTVGGYAFDTASTSVPRRLFG